MCIKGPCQESERQPSEWNKIFANHISNKGVVSRIYQELLRLLQPQKDWKKPNTVGPKYLNSHFSEEAL